MKFSVLLPTSNRLNLLKNAIETVRRQDYDDWEIIVSDNNSQEDVAGYIASLNDARIKYFSTGRFIPVTDNWNNALAHSTGDYVIMLGDDDCIMPGYFSTLSRLIEQYDSPDFVYTGALLYAYPGVLPGCPDGFLRSYLERRIYHKESKEFFLSREEALQYVKDSMNFRVEFDYNMQFSLVSRKLIKRMQNAGEFFQSPYPDYYASNAIMLMAERILVVPRPIVTIGISPKSFGYYYFNDAENEGNKFLNNLPNKEMVRRLKSVMLPGSAMNTSWLVAMETVAVNYGGQYGLKVNYDRYRTVQILSVLTAALLGKESAQRDYKRLRMKLRPGEWLRLWLPFIRDKHRVAPKDYPQLAHKWQQIAASHPAVDMPELQGKWTTMLDVFEHASPQCA